MEGKHLFTFPFDEQRMSWHYDHLFQDFLQEKLEHEFADEAIAHLHAQAGKAWEDKSISFFHFSKEFLVNLVKKNLGYTIPMAAPWNSTVRAGRQAEHMGGPEVYSQKKGYPKGSASLSIRSLLIIYYRRFSKSPGNAQGDR